MKKNHDRKNVLFIKFNLYKVENLETFETKHMIDTSKLQPVSSNNNNYNYNSKEVSASFSLKCGGYVIVPSCDDDRIGEDEFLIRIFLQKTSQSKYFLIF